jgi:glucose/arabinose dehydrogenase
MTHPIRRAALAAAAAVALAVGGTAGAAAAATVDTKAGPVAVEPLAKLDNPWGMAFLPDGRLLVTEKPGRLRAYADGKLSDPVGGVPAVAYKGQGGLLGVAVDPDFAKTQLVYLFFTEPADPQPAGATDTPEPRLGPNFKPDDAQVKGGAVARGRLEVAALTGVTVIWRQTPKTAGRGHYGGRLTFAPDGKLFVTSGERQRFEPAQDQATNLGTVVRINPDGSIPADNPFVGKPGVRPDVYSFGHRNPLGAVIHPASGKLWINEMGPKGGDELNVVEAGKNYGWPAVSEGVHYNDAAIPKHATQPAFAAPPQGLDAGHLAVRDDVLYGHQVPRLEGQRPARRAVVQGRRPADARRRQGDRRGADRHEAAGPGRGRGTGRGGPGAHGRQGRGTRAADAGAAVAERIEPEFGRMLKLDAMTLRGVGSYV